MHILDDIVLVSSLLTAFIILFFFLQNSGLGHF